jgi:nucleoside-diphosphate-sugar epimerase
MRIVVAGGTGTVGRFVVDAVRRGHDATVLTRSSGIDLPPATGWVPLPAHPNRRT